MSWKCPHCKQGIESPLCNVNLEKSVPISLSPGEFSPGPSFRDVTTRWSSRAKSQRRWAPQLPGEVRTGLGEGAASTAVRSF